MRIARLSIVPVIARRGVAGGFAIRRESASRCASWPPLRGVRVGAAIAHRYGRACCSCQFRDQRLDSRDGPRRPRRDHRDLVRRPAPEHLRRQGIRNEGIAGVLAGHRHHDLESAALLGQSGPESVHAHYRRRVHTATISG